MANGDSYTADPARLQQATAFIDEIRALALQLGSDFETAYAETQGWTGYEQGMDSYAQQAQPINKETYQKTSGTIRAIGDALTSTVKSTLDNLQNITGTQAGNLDAINNQATLGGALNSDSTISGTESGRH
jgi:hypothetical protein